MPPRMVMARLPKNHFCLPVIFSSFQLRAEKVLYHKRTIKSIYGFAVDVCRCAVLCQECIISFPVEFDGLGVIQIADARGGGGLTQCELAAIGKRQGDDIAREYGRHRFAASTGEFDFVLATDGCPLALGDGNRRRFFMTARRNGRRIGTRILCGLHVHAREIPPSNREDEEAETNDEQRISHTKIVSRASSSIRIAKSVSTTQGSTLRQSCAGISIAPHPSHASRRCRRGR